MFGGRTYELKERMFGGGPKPVWLAQAVDLTREAKPRLLVESDLEPIQVTAREHPPAA